MTTHYLFKLKNENTLEEALNELSSQGLVDIYVLEDIESEKHQIGGFGPESLPIEYHHVELEKASSSEISWEEQSAQFSPYYKDGLLEIPLQDFSSHEGYLRLKPGPGFGDLSHPTTNLVLQMISSFVKDQSVVDLGCGSGILSLAASLMGAKKVLGLDIDNAAILHADKNKSLNTLTNPVHFSLEIDPDFFEGTPSILLMNMTFLEQKAALASIECYVPHFSKILISGILAEQKEKYLEWAHECGWELISENTLDGWLGFYFLKRFI